MEVVVSWKRPITVTEVKIFLGSTGYYKHFIERFSNIALPLTKLTQKKTKFIWSDEYECCFEELKNRWVTTPELTIPLDSRGYVIFSDASN